MTRLAVAMGDPTGIGPEVLVRALADPPPELAGCSLLMVGDLRVWEQGQRIAGRTVPALPREEPGPMTKAGVPFLNVQADAYGWKQGVASPEAGRAAGAWLERAVTLALAGQVDGIVFAPFNKQALISSGYPVRDEYDLVAALSKVDEHDEMNVIPHPAAALDTDDPNTDNSEADPGGRLLWVARVTGHVSFREVHPRITRASVLRMIRIASRTTAAAGRSRPHVGVAALNPHAGEGGLLGDEEELVIRPAIADAEAEGLSVSGPYPADHIFRHARSGKLDAVVAMYHDQAQIATKLLGFDRGVSVGVGYPFVMTTPSHGTAFDIAGKGIADPRPMTEALRLAVRLARANAA